MTVKRETVRQKELSEFERGVLTGLIMKAMIRRYDLDFDSTGTIPTAVPKAEAA